MGSQIKSKIISGAIRVLVAAAAVVTYYATFTALDQLGKNPLADLTIWGISSAIALSFGVIYLINDNKAIDKRKKK